MKTLLLIDTHALIHRFFHALPPLTTPQGEPIGAIYGLSGVLLKLLQDGNGDTPPDYLAAALDRPEPTFRKEAFHQYKIQRPKASDALISQLKRLPEVFAMFHINTFSLAGFEADDVIGSLTEKFSREPDLKTVILSGDLDILQLVRDKKVFGNIIKTGTSTTMLYDEKAVVLRYGLRPTELPDYKGLVGDVSDNIPGVDGIGPKTAAELLKEFKNLEGIYENIALIPKKVAEKLVPQKEKAFLARQLATIRNDVPLEAVSLSALARPAVDLEKMRSFFERLGFSSLVKRLSV